MPTNVLSRGSKKESSSEEEFFDCEEAREIEDEQVLEEMKVHEVAEEI